jgi:hypothetical protein
MELRQCSSALARQETHAEEKATRSRVVYSASHRAGQLGKTSPPLPHRIQRVVDPEKLCLSYRNPILPAKSQ